MRRRMQVVFQDPFGSLGPRMTVGRIVGEGLALHQPELDRAGRDRLVATVLDEVGLQANEAKTSTMRPATVSTSSPGASASASPSPVPSSSVGGARARRADLGPLDVSVQQQVLALLVELQRRYAMSYVFISHDLLVVRAMSHRVLVMKDGAVVEEGEAEALFAAPQQPYTRDLLAAAHLS